MQSISVRFKTDRRWKLALVALLATVSLGGCVTRGKYKDLEAENEQLASEAAALGDTVAGLEMDLATRNAEVEELGGALQAEREVYESQTQKYSDLVARLSGEVEDGKIAVEQMQSGINVRIADEILFQSGSASLGENGREVIGRLGGELQDVGYQILVGGYTDNVPISRQLAKVYPTNWELAAARAASVARVLEEAGVARQQLLVVSFGENSPVASNDTAEGRRKNRRIEVRIRPVEVDLGDDEGAQM